MSYRDPQWMASSHGRCHHRPPRTWENRRDRVATPDHHLRLRASTRQKLTLVRHLAKVPPVLFPWTGPLFHCRNRQTLDRSVLRLPLTKLRVTYVVAPRAQMRKLGCQRVHWTLIVKLL